MKAPLYSKQGKKVKDVDLTPAIYGSRVNARLLALVNKAYAAALRSGTAETKERAQVRGGGKKPWRQKGTGRARAGSSRSPIWRGGGTTFGPHKRSYAVHLSKSMRKQALISALSLRGRDKGLMLLENVELKSGKTKEWADVVKALPLKKKRTLCVVKELSDHLKRASRNLTKWVELKRASDVNAYHILRRPRLVIEEEALKVLETNLLSAAKKEAQSKKPVSAKKTEPKTGKTGGKKA